MNLKIRAIPLGFALLATLAMSITALAAERKKVLIKSTADGTDQPSYIILPDDFDRDGAPVPLLVSLHTWSGDLEQRNLPLEEAANRKGWLYLFPNFRGRNDHPEACGSAKARQDVVDAVNWALGEYPVDRKRIYLTGVSGGGHMTMLMAGRHPEIWAAASAWVGISDLAAWYERHQDGKYGEMMRRCTGGVPGARAEIDAAYRDRSPLTSMARAASVPVDIAAGIHDGHEGSVPIRHSIDAFNAIATAVGASPVSDQEIAELSRRDGRLENPLPGDQVEDPSFGRELHLRRHAAKSRLTIFEGGHEGIASAAVAWLEKHSKQ